MPEPERRDEHRALRRRPATAKPGGLVFDRERQAVEFGRVVSLSDGVFGVAFTLLVLAIEVPAGTQENLLAAALTALSPMVSAYVVSVVVIAIFWFAHHGLFTKLQAVDGPLMGLNIAYLGLIVLIPFGQRVQGDFPFQPLSYALYAVVLASIAAVDTVCHLYAHRAGLTRTPWSRQRFRVEMLRSLAPFAVFALSVPAAFVLVNWTVLFWFLLLPLDRVIVRLGADDGS